MDTAEEAGKYIEEIKKRGIKLYKIANASPDELSESMNIDRKLAEKIIELAKREVYEKMDKKHQKNPKKSAVIKLPHVGEKRLKIFKEKNLTIEKIAELKPEELKREVPYLKWREAEDIIIAAELEMERRLENKKSFDRELLKIPYIGAGRAYVLHSNGIRVEDIAKMRPENLMKIFKDMKREQAEKAIISAENYVEKKLGKEETKEVKSIVAKTQKIQKPVQIGRMKKGLVNGNSLVNGRGVVNGLGPRRNLRKGQKRRIYPILAVMAMIILSMLLPIIYLTPINQIKIDGSFSDWSNIRGINDPYGVADGPLESVKAVEQGGLLYIYVKASDKIFEGPEGLFVFLDTDEKNSTGYYIGGLGADYMVSIIGWDGKVHSSEVYRYISRQGNNWSAFSPYSGASAAVKSNQIELSVPIKAKNPEILAYLKTNKWQDGSDIPLFPHDNSALVVVSNTKNNSGNLIEKVNIYPSGEMHFNLSFEPIGNFTGLNYSMSILENRYGKMVKIGDGRINMKINSPETFYIKIVANGTGTIGFVAKTNDENVRIINRVMSIRFGKVEKGVDYNFDEWKDVSGTADPEGDVVKKGNYSHENIDLLEIKRLGSYFYIKTAAPILAGDYIPEVIMKPIIDSDRDTVPDKFDPYPHDFNNDGIPDNESYVVVNGKKLPDVDGDGIPDYPYGPDMWLNTTIPSWFPKPYAGRHVSVYIGPLPKETVTGNDTFYVYIKSKNGAFHAPYLPFSSNYMVKISGKGFHASSYLFKFTGRKWVKVRKVPIAFVNNQLEGNAYVNGTIFVLARDWLGQYDMAGNSGNREEITIEKVNYPPETTSENNLIVDGTTIYLNGTKYYNEVKIINDGKIIVNGTLELHVKDISIGEGSSITANYTGYSGGVGGNANNNYVGTKGSGEGGGGGGGNSPNAYPVGAGGGGGGYGATGGSGGASKVFRNDRNGGEGGAEYGTADGEDIEMGSGGGGGGGYSTAGSNDPDAGRGGNGGGCIEIYSSQNITINGGIYANGENGHDSLYGGGGGGGSGGGILLYGVNVTLSSSCVIDANGGNGGNSTYGGSGGGGGGGRIKILYSNILIDNAKNIEANGGTPGSKGSYGLKGKNGASGLIYSGKIPEFGGTWLIPTIVFIAITQIIARRKKKYITNPSMRQICLKFRSK